MLEFRQTMDSHARAVYRVGRIKEELGSIQWHPDREKRFVICADILGQLTLSEMKEIVAQLEKK